MVLPCKYISLHAVSTWRRFLLRTVVMISFFNSRTEGYITGRTRSWNPGSSASFTWWRDASIPRVSTRFHAAWFCVRQGATPASSIFLSACQNVISTWDSIATVRRVKNIKVAIWHCQRGMTQQVNIHCQNGPNYRTITIIPNEIS